MKLFISAFNLLGVFFIYFFIFETVHSGKKIWFGVEGDVCHTSHNLVQQELKVWLFRKSSLLEPERDIFTSHFHIIFSFIPERVHKSFSVYVYDRKWEGSRSWSGLRVFVASVRGGCNEEGCFSGGEWEARLVWKKAFQCDMWLEIWA